MPRPLCDVVPNMAIEKNWAQHQNVYILWPNLWPIIYIFQKLHVNEQTN